MQNGILITIRQGLDVWSGSQGVAKCRSYLCRVRVHGYVCFLWPNSLKVSALEVVFYAMTLSSHRRCSSSSIFFRTVYAGLLRKAVCILHWTYYICPNQAPTAENNPEDPAQPNRFNAVIEKIERLYMVTVDNVIWLRIRHSLIVDSVFKLLG